MANSKPTIVLVHGAWHGSWCWKYQLPALAAKGYTSIETVDLLCTGGVPGTTQFDDANHVRAAIEPLLAVGKQVVVVGHSYGGPIASAAVRGLSLGERSQAGLPGGVVGLIVLCGYVFPGGMDQGAVIRDMGGLPYAIWDSPSEGLFVLKDAPAMFFPPGGDVSEELAAWALPQLRPQSSAANLGIVPPQAWQDDKYAGGFGYIFCSSDTVIPLEQQEAMVETAGGKGRWSTRTLEGASHFPFLSRPEDVAVTIDDIVNEFSKSG
jgi:pimeloyl-ACP methyl ester carboxylesterase